MKPLEVVWETMIQLVKRVCLIPRMIGHAGEHRRRQATLMLREAERIDRICNPSKYRGK